MLRRKPDKPLLEAARLIGRAQRLRDSGRFREAADIYAELVRRFDDWPARREEGLPPALSALGYTLWKCGDLTEAVGAFDRAAVLQHERGRLDDAESAWESAARILGEARDFDGAAVRAQRAVEIAQELDNPVVISRARHVLGQSLLLQGRMDEAAAAVLAAVELELGDDAEGMWDRCKCYELLARIAIERRNWPEARSWVGRLEQTMPPGRAGRTEYDDPIRDLIAQIPP